MKQPQRWFFVSDVDDTLLGDDSGLVALSEALRATSQALIVAYNSSRPCASVRATLDAVPDLALPDYLIGALGTEIEEGQTGQPLAEYSQRLHPGWSREQVCDLIDPLHFIPHPADFQTALKVSYTIPDEAAYDDVRQRLEAAGLKVRLIFSGGHNLDIIPHAAGKASAVRYLCRYLGIPQEHVVVAGDSANDADMFVPPFKGIVVANAEAALKQQKGDTTYHARAAFAWGVLEGLKHWEVLK